jgi:hypothetical protein
VKIECTSCGATGLYSGFAESKDHAVICHTCKGKGYRDVQTIDDNATFTEFSGRKPKPGIQYVYVSGDWMSPNRSKITIEQFNNLTS